MVAPVEYRSCPPEYAVDGARQQRAERFHPAGECFFAVRLDDQVGVISWEGVVQEPKLPPLAARTEAFLKLPDQPAGTEAREPAARSEGDMRR